MTTWTVGDSNSDPTATYSTRLWGRRWADRTYGQAAGDVEVDTRAVGGCVVWTPPSDTSHLKLSTWLPAMLDATPISQRPSRLLIMCGTNNLHATADSGLADLYAAWEGLHTRLEGDYGLEVWWLTIPPIRLAAGSPWPADWEPALTTRRAAINAWLRAAMGGRARLIDTAPALEDAGRLRADCSYDGVHLNSYGHVRLADAIPLTLPG